VDNPKLPLPEPEVIPPDFAREAHVRNIFDEVVDEYLAANPVRQAA
jgi:hypothetical protein